MIAEEQKDTNGLVTRDEKRAMRQRRERDLRREEEKNRERERNKRMEGEGRERESSHHSVCLDFP